jgi:cell division cycle protein 37
MKVSSLDKSRAFLILHGDVLLQENASNYLLLASLEDEMNGFREKMRLTARQSQLISNIAELAKTMKTHPGNVINPFFKRLEEKEHLGGFMTGLETFIQNLIKRAVVKRKEIDEEQALEDGVDLKDVPEEERLGPGGLDPVEVFDSLPASMQEAFESRNTEQLMNALMELTPDEAELCMKRGVDSGLWNEG